MAKKPEEINVIVATDCGSTTTKAIMIEKQGEEYRLMYRGEAPTTVEAPFEDVTMGVLNAIEEVEELSGRKLIDENRQIIRPSNGNIGTDIYISTSSAGGGLQMMVAGVVRQMSAESAERAALGAGAIVMDVISINDKRLPHEQIDRIRRLRPDMILLSGGVDGGTVSHIVEMAEIIQAANPRPRLGISYNLPVIFAGNKEAREEVKKTLEAKVDLSIVDNLRPQLEAENLLPAREKIHDLFLEHVMAQAPGYKKLMSWTDAPIMPTPGAVGNIMQTISRLEDIQVVGVDIGGATTDVFSVFNDYDDEELTKYPIFNRTVSANLGMSYSISNVFKESGLKNVMRWLPFKLDERALRNQVKNKMIRPTTIPQMMKTLIFEQAIAREALRLAFIHHKSFATKLKGVQQTKDIADAFSQGGSDTLVDMMELNMIIGSGGVLSHAPRRHQSALMMIDAFEPEGITRLTVDSIFMMPQLGVLASLHDKAALDVFHKDCLIYLGTCVSPAGKAKYDKPIMDYSIELPDGTVEGTLKYGEMKLFELPVGMKAKSRLKPYRGFDLGEGNGKVVETDIEGGVVGIVLDGRGRPLEITEDEDQRVELLLKWLDELKIYPIDVLKGEK